MAQHDTSVDVAIIGAGPAGSAAAIELGSAGRRTLLIERTHFPREKVCGGCLSRAATVRVQELIGPSRALPGVAARKLTFAIGSYRFECDVDGMTRMAPRSELDAALADAAARAGAEVRYGCAATLTRHDGGWDLDLAGERVRARTILVASGLGSLPRQLGIQARRRRRRLIGQMWFQVPGPELPVLGEVELQWLRGGYIGMATPSPQCCVVACAIDASEPCGGNAYEGLRRRNRRSSIWDRLGPDAPRIHNARGIAGFPWTPDRLGADNVLLIGDAAGFEEPYSGEGIGQALRSAACAARAVLAGRDLVAAYTAFMRHRHARVLRRTRLISGLLNHPLARFLAGMRPVLPGTVFAQVVRRTYLGGVS